MINKTYDFRMHLMVSGWQPSISTSTHILYHKGNWQCAIHQITGEVCFSREMKADTVDLLRGPVEEGIE